MMTAVYNLGLDGAVFSIMGDGSHRHIQQIYTVVPLHALHNSMHCRMVRS